MIYKTTKNALSPFLLCFFGIFILTPFNAEAQEKISLQRAIELALQNNLQIKQAQLNEALSSETLSQSRYAIYPSFNGSTNTNYSIGRSFDQLSGQLVEKGITSLNTGVNSSVTLFQGYQKINQIAQNKFELEADKSNTARIKNDLMLAVVTTYLQILSGQDLVEAAKQQVTLATQQLDREQKFFDVGEKTIADLSQSKAQLAAAELNLTDAQNQSDLAFLNLAQLLELDPAAPIDVVRPVTDDPGKIAQYTASEVFKSSLNNYPEVKFAEFRRLASEKGVEIAKGNHYPRLTLGGNLGTGYSTSRQQYVQGTNPPVFERINFADQLNENINRSIGLSLSFPIFNGYQARSSVRRAKIGLQNAEISVQLAKNNLNKIVNQSVYDLRAAEKRYNSAQSAFESSRTAFSAIEQRYGVGLVNSLDFNQAQTNLNRAQFDLIQAKYDVIFRSKVIDFYLGNPLTF
ncbi:MAG TPA: TolC family protein [Sphingobacteriaceae bacterium]|nr:TolC family protein [Sphingobacteriaceae bacterium]